MKRRLFKRLIGAAAIAAALLSGVISAFAAFTPGDGTGNGTQVRNSVVLGRTYLISQQGQGGPGCWTSQNFTTGVTALAVLALVNSEQGGYANLDATTKAAVDAGTTCLMAHFVPGPGANEGTFQDCAGCEYQTYNTSTTIWALSDVPSTPAIASAIAAGRQWLVDNQRNAPDPAGRADTGGNVNNGGWYYFGGTTAGFVEHSNSSFALQGLEASGGIPAATADLAQGFFTCLQMLNQPQASNPACGSGAFPLNDGGFIYSHQGNKGGTETSATGSGSFSLSATGVPSTDPRITATMAYLDASIGQNPCENYNHTQDSLSGGWVATNTLRHYAVWANFKAHDAAGIPASLSDSNNWYYKLANCLVSEQLVNGQWPDTNREDAILATAFSMLTLEKVTPEAPIGNAQGVAFSGTEGVNSCGHVATFTDSDTKAVAGDYTATIDWGDGATSSGTITGDGSGNFTVAGCHTYAEEGPYTVKVTITDVDNSSNNANVTSTATVVDASLSGSCTAPGVFGTAFAGQVATFTDQSSTGTPDDFSATINWGDGSSSPGVIAGGPGNVPYTVSGTHTYATPGFYTISTTVTDVGGSTLTMTCGSQSFVIPPSTPGCDIDGAGRIKAANGDKAIFTVDANLTPESDPSNDEDNGNDQEHGNIADPHEAENVQTYRDVGPANPFSFTSTQVLAVTCNDSKSGSIYGSGTVDGTVVFFIIDVTAGNGKDDEEEGRSSTYRIRLSNGYDSGQQIVRRGEIKVEIETDTEDSGHHHGGRQE